MYCNLLSICVSTNILESLVLWNKRLCKAEGSNKQSLLITECYNIDKNQIIVLFLTVLHVSCIFMHPRPPGRHIGIDGQPLILSFELKFFVCRHVSMWWFQNRVCSSVHLSVGPSVRLSVRTPRKEIIITSLISVLH